MHFIPATKPRARILLNPVFPAKLFALVEPASALRQFTICSCSGRALRRSVWRVAHVADQAE